jgi:NTP pyrophosphatase (non-canonical NTP hydrolase)
VSEVCEHGFTDSHWYYPDPTEKGVFCPVPPDEEIPWIAEKTTAPHKSLADMAEEVINNNIARGWRGDREFDQKRTIGDELMLIVTECAEAWRAARAIRALARGRHPSTYGEQLMDAVVMLANAMEAYRKDSAEPLTKPDEGNLDDELADILIRLLDTAYWREIDLAEAYERKMQFNRTRPYRHGDKKL